VLDPYCGIGTTLVAAKFWAAITWALTSAKLMSPSPANGCKMRKRNERELRRNFPCMSCEKLSKNAKKEENGLVGLDRSRWQAETLNKSPSKSPCQCRMNE
jgi:hypothetical protein